MRPKTPEPSGVEDLFKARLDQIINMEHELVRLAGEIDWSWIDDQLADRYRAGGRLVVPTRFMVGFPWYSPDAFCEPWP